MKNRGHDLRNVEDSAHQVKDYISPGGGVFSYARWAGTGSSRLAHGLWAMNAALDVLGSPAVAVAVAVAGHRPARHHSARFYGRLLWPVPWHHYAWFRDCGWFPGWFRGRCQRAVNKARPLPVVGLTGTLTTNPA